MTSTPSPDARKALRQQLRSARQAWAATESAQLDQALLTSRLQDALSQIEPLILGVYWPMTGEFNPRDIALWAQRSLGCKLALPHARKSPVKMDFISWGGEQPEAYDEWGIPCPKGPLVEPDVLLVPCLGFTPQGYRLGYGGGYYDRYLAAHPGVCALGVAWDEGQLRTDELGPQAHDQPLMAVFTPRQTWGE